MYSMKRERIQTLLIVFCAALGLSVFFIPSASAKTKKINLYCTPVAVYCGTNGTEIGRLAVNSSMRSNDDDDDDDSYFHHELTLKVNESKRVRVSFKIIPPSVYDMDGLDSDADEDELEELRTNLNTYLNERKIYDNYDFDLYHKSGSFSTVYVKHDGVLNTEFIVGSGSNQSVRLMAIAWLKHNIVTEIIGPGSIQTFERAGKGSEIYILASPDDGYVLQSLSVEAGPENSIDISQIVGNYKRLTSRCDYENDEDDFHSVKYKMSSQQEPAYPGNIIPRLHAYDEFTFIMPDSEVHITATFAPAARVTFINWDGSVLQSKMVAIGDIPIYKEKKPERPADARGEYTFAGWNQELSRVTGDITYTAVYSETLNSYDVTVSAENGTITADKTRAQVDELVTLTLAPGTVEYHPGGLFVRCGDQNVITTKVDNTTWTFRMPAGDAAAEAVFIRTDSVVYFINYGGDTLDWQSLYVGNTPVDPADSEIPVRPEDAQYTYTFAGWDHPITQVTEEIEFYYATYTATTNSYPVRFEDWDGTVLQSSVEDYGTVPEYTGNQPVRATDAQAVYDFRGWSPAIGEVTGETVFSADYEVTPFLRTGASEIEITKEITNAAVGGNSYEYTCLFIPESDGYYLFESDGDDINPLIRILDGDNVIAYDYDSGWNWHFRLMQELEGGKTYTVRVESRKSGALSLDANKVIANTVTLDQSIEHGSISCETAEAYEGQQVFIILNPEEGYQLAELNVTDEDGDPVEVDIDTFFMPDYPVNVTARFELPKPIMAAAADEHIAPADISVNGLLVFDRENPAAVSGTKVELQAACDDGYIVGTVTITTASGLVVPYKYNIGGISFTMPDEPVTVLLASQPAAFGMADLVLPGDTEIIEERAFEGDVGISSVEIPSGCTKIGKYAFRQCTKLRKIRIPGNCELDTGVFSGCGMVYIYGVKDSPAEEYCTTHSSCEFVEE